MKILTLSVACALWEMAILLSAENRLCGAALISLQVASGCPIPWLRSRGRVAFGVRKPGLRDHAQHGIAPPGYAVIEPRVQAAPACVRRALDTRSGGSPGPSYAQSA